MQLQRATLTSPPVTRLTLLVHVTLLALAVTACSDAEPSLAGSSGSQSAGGSLSSGGGSAGGGGAPGGSSTGTLAGSAGTGTTFGGSGGGGSSSLGTGGGGAAGAGSIEASFNTFKQIIPTSCFGPICHDLPEHPFHMVLDDTLYTTLTTHMTKHCGPVITPGSPENSALVKLMKGPCNGTDRMPYGKCVDDTDEGCVPSDVVAAIEKWIANGAPK